METTGIEKISVKMNTSKDVSPPSLNLMVNRFNQVPLSSAFPMLPVTEW